MKTQSQLSMIALVTFFTMAAATLIALFCISNLSTEAAPVERTDPSSNTTGLPSTETPLPPDTPKEDASSPEKDSLSPPAPCELRFTSNGDGTCVLSGLGTYADPCVIIPVFSPEGERVTSIAPMAFYQNQTVTAVQLPASIITIGALAFADCPNLVYVSVSADNPYFCDVDGILYTADESTLLLYPPMRSGSEVGISAHTVRIADMAFYRCTYLSLVRYGGTAEQWEKIRIGIKNYSLTAAAKEFSDML